MKRTNFMQEAFSQALKAYKNNEVPVGAIIVNPTSNQIIASNHNRTYSNNHLCHAEMLVMEEAAKKLNSKRLDGLDLYVTLEPCAMCSAAISHMKIRRLYFGLTDEKFGAVVSNLNFFESKACHHKSEYYYGFLEEDISLLLKEFFRLKRK